MGPQIGMLRSHRQMVEDCIGVSAWIPICLGFPNELAIADRSIDSVADHVTGPSSLRGSSLRADRVQKRALTLPSGANLLD